MKLHYFLFFAGMNITEAEKYFNTVCEALFDDSESKEIFSRVVEHLTGKTKFQIIQDRSIQIDEEHLKEIVAQLQVNKPIQYILGYEWFYNLKIEVNQHVLIPRPETEELMRWLVEDIKTTKGIRPLVLDIGTGSGCIPVAIQHALPFTQLIALDSSSEALIIAKKNASAYHLDIKFLEADILSENINLSQAFDYIISNPPYITFDEKKEMNSRVLNFEPSEALFVTNHDPLQFYKAIITFANKSLSPNGVIFLEVNQLYGTETESLYQNAGFDTELKMDMYGNVRMLKAKRKT